MNSLLADRLSLIWTYYALGIFGSRDFLYFCFFHSSYYCLIFYSITCFFLFIFLVVKYLYFSFFFYFFFSITSILQTLFWRLINIIILFIILVWFLLSLFGCNVASFHFIHVISPSLCHVLHIPIWLCLSFILLLNIWILKFFASLALLYYHSHHYKFLFTSFTFIMSQSLPFSLHFSFIFIYLIFHCHVDINYFCHILITCVINVINV